jgi:ribonucleotide monophosphatase NagD (HAD superfamily)
VTELIDSLADVRDRYDALFCDLWGCVHDGVRAFPEAVAALRAFKAGAGRSSWSPTRPAPGPAWRKQLLRLGVPEDCWDAIATSGDAARLAMFEGVVGTKVWHVGEPHDAPFFEPPAILENPARSRRSRSRRPRASSAPALRSPCRPIGHAAAVPAGQDEGPALLCANPDIVVDRGESREWCAGALAQLYTEMGGESLYFGKPHPPIYDLARRRLDQIGRSVPEDRILAVGDGIFTDIQGGMGENIDTLFITGGLAREETGTDPSGSAGCPETGEVPRQGGTRTQLRHLSCSAGASAALLHARDEAESRRSRRPGRFSCCVNTQPRTD